MLGLALGTLLHTQGPEVPVLEEELIIEGLWLKHKRHMFSRNEAFIWFLNN